MGCIADRRRAVGETPIVTRIIGPRRGHGDRHG